MNKKQQARHDAVISAREILARATKRDGTPIVYTILRHCSASGMTRWLDLYCMVDGEPRRLTWKAATIMDWPYDAKRDALKVSGCGMDMGFHAVYTLARYIYRDAVPEGVRDAGYALHHEWM